MYYGNAQDTTSEANPAGVWGNYAGVWHLPNGSSLSATNSVTNVSGTINGSTSAAAGQIDGAAKFNNSASDAITTDISSSSATKTYEIWANIAGAGGSNRGRIFEKRVAGAQVEVFYVNTSADAGAPFLEYDRQFSGGSAVWHWPPPSLNVWHHIVMTYNDSSSGNDPVLYVDGILQTVTALRASGTVTDNTDNYVIGNRGNDFARVYNGSLDEFRISNSIVSADWIKTEYNNQNAPSTFMNFGAEEIQPTAQINGGWYNPSWLYRKKIVINHSQVSGTSTLSNFPVLVSTTQQILSYTSFGGHVASSTGGDILFTSSDGTTKLNYEREFYSSSTGQLIAWVQVPSLSPSTDTVLYVYYGNGAGGLADQQNKTATWDTNYVGIYHYPDGTTLNLNDSTSNAYNLSHVSGVSTAVLGQVDGGVNYNGSQFDHNSSFTMGSSGGQDISIEFWMKVASGVNNLTQPVSIMTQSGIQAQATLDASNNLYWDFGVHHGSGLSTSYSSYTGVWTHVTMTAKGNNTSEIIYLNGVNVANTASYTAPTAPYHDIFTGVGETNFLNGSIDEVRVSNIVRSPDWIKTEYNNQNTPQYFYSLSGSALQNRPAATPLLKSRGGVKFH